MVDFVAENCLIYYDFISDPYRFGNLEQIMVMISNRYKKEVNMERDCSGK